jgi:hypothetical protein
MIHFMSDPTLAPDKALGVPLGAADAWRRRGKKASTLYAV